METDLNSWVSNLPSPIAVPNGSRNGKDLSFRWICQHGLGYLLVILNLASRIHMTTFRVDIPGGLFRGCWRCWINKDYNKNRLLVALSKKCGGTSLYENIPFNECAGSRERCASVIPNVWGSDGSSIKKCTHVEKGGGLLHTYLAFYFFLVASLMFHIVMAQSLTYEIRNPSVQMLTPYRIFQVTLPHQPRDIYTSQRSANG